MKNVLVFITPKKKFFGEPRTLAKIQIHNSLDLGWKREDIILATNFDFEYDGVKSIVVSDKNYVSHYHPESKHHVIAELFKRGFLDKNETYFFHDLDAYQQEIITEKELEMEDGVDMSLTDYGWRERWNTGVIFFKFGARDIFENLIKIQSLFSLFRSTDEGALMMLTKGLTEEEEERVRKHPSLMTMQAWALGPYEAHRLVDKLPRIENIEKRVKKINLSYNFVPLYETKKCYEMAEKPIKVVHFHPFVRYLIPTIPNMLDFYMYGKNDINTVFMSKRLKKIFNYHRIK